MYSPLGSGYKGQWKAGNGHGWGVYSYTNGERLVSFSPNIPGSAFHRLTKFVCLDMKANGRMEKETDGACIITQSK